MGTGELGLAGEPAVSPVDLEPRQGQEFATIQHHPMVEQHAVDQPQGAKPVLQQHAHPVGLTICVF